MQPERTCVPCRGAVATASKAPRVASGKFRTRAFERQKRHGKGHSLTKVLEELSYAVPGAARVTVAAVPDGWSGTSVARPTTRVPRSRDCVWTGRVTCGHVSVPSDKSATVERESLSTPPHLERWCKAPTVVGGEVRATKAPYAR